jgi:hypothetical protein
MLVGVRPQARWHVVHLTILYSGSPPDCDCGFAVSAAFCPAGVLFFVQLLPAAITCFEYHKFLQEVRLAQ